MLGAALKLSHADRAMQARYKTFMCLCNKYVGMHEVWHGMQNGAMTIGRNIFRSLTEQECNFSQQRGEH